MRRNSLNLSLAVLISLATVGCSDSSGPSDPFDGVPTATLLEFATAPSPPEGLNFRLRCFVAPDNTTQANVCPALTWGPYTYWPFTEASNATSMAFVAYDKQNVSRKTITETGARYPWRITVEIEEETVTLWGQDENTIVIPWDDLKF